MYRYLAMFPHRPLMYPSTLSVQSTQQLQFIWNQTDYDHLTVSNTLESFADSDLARDLATRRSMIAVCHCFLGVAVGWKVNRTTLVCVHSTDSELRAYFEATKITKTYQSLLSTMGLAIQEPIIIHEDNQSVISIFTTPRMTPWVKHIDIPVCYAQEQFNLRNSAPLYTPSKMLLADSSTKPISGPVLKVHTDFLFGTRFYPPPTSSHYDQLSLTYHGLSYPEILKLLSSYALVISASEDGGGVRAQSSLALFYSVSTYIFYILHTSTRYY